MKRLVGLSLVTAACLISQLAYVDSAKAQGGYSVVGRATPQVDSPVVNIPRINEQTEKVAVSDIVQMRISLKNPVMIIVTRDSREILYWGKDFAEAYAMMNMLREGACPSVILEFENAVDPYANQVDEKYYRDFSTHCNHANHQTGENEYTTCSCGLVSDVTP